MGKYTRNLLGWISFEKKDFRGIGKTIFFNILSDLSYLKPTVKENITTKTNTTSYAKTKNITTRDTWAREIIVTFLETAPRFLQGD